MYNAPVPLTATTGLLALTGISSIVLIVAAFTILAAGLALLTLVPRRQS